MTDTTSTEEERTLVEITGLLHDGILASPGRITLTDRTLRFAPKATYKLLGVKTFAIPIAEVAGAEVEGINRLLRVRTSQRVYVFSGGQIRVIRDRLASMIDTIEDVEAVYDEDERILSVFAAQRPVGKVMSTEGTIVLTNKRIHFQPGGVGGLLWRKAGFSLDISVWDTSLSNSFRKKILKSAVKRM